MSQGQILSVETTTDELVIRIGINTLAWAAEHMNDWNPWDNAKRDFVQKWKITNPIEFAKDVHTEMVREAEDGSSPLTNFLDAMMNAAADQGSTGVDEDTSGLSVYAKDAELRKEDER